MSTLIVLVAYLPLFILPGTMGIYSDFKLFLFYIVTAILLFVIALNRQFTFHTKHLQLIMLVTLITLVSTFLANASWQSFFGSSELQIGTLFFITLGLFNMGLVQTLTQQNNQKAFIKHTLICTLIICLYGLLQYLNLDPLIPDIRELSYRIIGTLGQPNFLGQFLLFPFFILLFHKKNFWNLILLGLISLCIFLTINKATWLGIGFAVFLYLLNLTSWKKITKAGIWIGSLISGLGLIIANPLGLRSVSSRLQLWLASFSELSLKETLVGKGLASFQDAYGKIMTADVFAYEEFFTQPAQIHSEVLQIFFDLGILGLIAYFLVYKLVLQNLFIKENKFNTSIKLSLVAYLISISFGFAVLENWILVTVFLSIYYFQHNPDFKTVALNKAHQMVLITCTVCLTTYASLNYMGAVMLKNNIETAFESTYVNLKNIANNSPTYYFHASPLQKSTQMYLALLGKSSLYNPYYQTLARRADRLSNSNLKSILLAAKLSNNINEIDQLISRAYSLGPNLPIVAAEAYEIYAEIGQCERALVHKNQLLSLAPKRYTENIDQCLEIDECRIFLKHAGRFSDIISDQRCTSF